MVRSDRIKFCVFGTYFPKIKIFTVDKKHFWKHFLFHRLCRSSLQQRLRKWGKNLAKKKVKVSKFSICKKYQNGLLGDSDYHSPSFPCIRWVNYPEPVLFYILPIMSIEKSIFLWFNVQIWCWRLRTSSHWIEIGSLSLALCVGAIFMQTERCIMTLLGKTRSGQNPWFLGLIYSSAVRKKIWGALYFWRKSTTKTKKAAEKVWRCLHGVKRT